MGSLLKVFLKDEQTLTVITLDGGIPSVVFGPSLQASNSLRELPWNQKVRIQYRDRDQEPTTQEIPVGELMHLIGSDYTACEPPKIYQVSSEEQLFKRTNRN